MNNDELILRLIAAKRDGLTIMYGDVGHELKVEENHCWDLKYNYRVIRPREYIVFVSKDGEVKIVATKNNWTKSDFGRLKDGDEYILMREVFKEDM